MGKRKPNYFGVLGGSSLYYYFLFSVVFSRNVNLLKNTESSEIR